MLWICRCSWCNWNFVALTWLYLYIPRGRGSRSVLKRLKNGTTIHDAGYFIPIELDGPEVHAPVLFPLLACNFPHPLLAVMIGFSSSMVEQSYWLCSLQDALLSILRMVLCPSPAEKTPDLKHRQDQVMRGVCYENAMVFTCSPQTVWGTSV